MIYWALIAWLSLNTFFLLYKDSKIVFLKIPRRYKNGCNGSKEKRMNICYMHILIITTLALKIKNLK